MLVSIFQKPELVSSSDAPLAQSRLLSRPLSLPAELRICIYHCLIELEEPHHHRDMISHGPYFYDSLKVCLALHLPVK